MAKNLKQKNGKWKKTEHERFMKALEKYGKNWVEVQKFVKTRSLPQVRSHAQKMLIHLTKEEKKMIQMNDFERMVDFCKVKDNSNSYEDSKKEKQVIQMKKELKTTAQIKAEEKEPNQQIKVEEQANQEIPKFLIHSSPTSEKFHFGSPFEMPTQMVTSNFCGSEVGYPVFNPYMFWDFRMFANPEQSEQGRNGWIMPPYTFTSN